MTAAHIENLKSLLVTFTTAALAARFVRFMAKNGSPVHCHDDRVVMIVECSDSVDRMATELKRDRRVSFVHVDWYIG